MNEINNVEIFAPGHWFPSNGPKEGVSFSLDQVKKLVRNSIAAGTRAILKIGHSDKQVFQQPGGQPALGVANNFRMRGEKVIADFKNIPSVVHKAIKKGLFKSLSAELGMDRKNGIVFTHIALLGAELPAVKNLKDLELYFSEAEEADKLHFSLSWNETQNTLGAQLRDKSIFKPDTILTKDVEGVDGVQLVVGQLKDVPGDTKVEQSYLFNESWTKESAQKWLADNTDFQEPEIVFQFSEPNLDNIFKDEKMSDEKIKQLSDTVETLTKSVEELLKFKDKADTLESEVADLKTANTKKETDLETANSKIAQFEEQAKEMRFEEQKKTVMSNFKDDVSEGKLPPALLTEIEAHLDGQKATFSDESELHISAALAKKVGLAYADKLPSGEHGDDLDGQKSMSFSDPSQEIMYEYNLMKKETPEMKFEDALSILDNTNPALMTSYRDWTNDPDNFEIGA